MVFIGNKAKQQLWDERIETFLASGLSQRAWCQEQGLPEHQLRYRLNKYKSKMALPVASRWVSMETSTPTSAGISLRIGDVIVEVKRGYDQQVLVDIVQTLMSVC